MNKISFFEECYWRLRKYINYDITCLLDADKERSSYIGCGIYILVVCSGIEFFGSIALPNQSPHNNKKLGLKGKSKKGFIYYVNNFMGKVDAIYQQNKIAEFLYEIIRCGQIHEAIAKGGVILGKEASRNFHLKYIANLKRINFNPRIFATDFLESLDYLDELLFDEIRKVEMANILSENYNLTIDVLNNYLSSFSHVRADNESLEMILENSSSFPSYEYSESKGYISRYQ